MAKIAAVGERGVGLTSLLDAACGGEFSEDPTPASEVYTVTARGVQMQIADQDKDYMKKVRSQEGVRAFVLAYSCVDSGTLAGLQSLLTHALGNTPGVSIVVVGTKKDLHNSRDYASFSDCQREIDKLKGARRIFHCQTSAKSKSGISEFVNKCAAACSAGDEGVSDASTCSCVVV